MAKFVPDSLRFPVEVEVKYSSKEYMDIIRHYTVPKNQIAMWTLGQNGYILKTDQGTLIAVDPYLTDYCGSRRSGVRTEKSRILPIFIEPEDFDVDCILITHSHTDHADPFTLERLNEGVFFMAPWQAANVIKDAGISDSHITLIHPLQSEKFADIEITGAFAEPTDTSDLNHMGFVLQFQNGKSYYNSGDTAKSELLAHVKDFEIDWMTICINGGYHNLSHWEAAEITSLIQPKVAIPAHYDMMPHNVQPPHMFKKSLSIKAPEVKYLQMNYYEAYLF